jgi:MFS transporter, DHA1 family, multidrug resistance protein
VSSWRRNQQVTVAMVFVVYLGFAFVLPFLPLYVRELGVTSQDDVVLWAGVLIGVAPLLAGLLAPVWGRWAERYGHKPVALRALGAYVVLLALSGLVSSPWQLFALRAGIGLTGGIGPLSLAMAASQAPRELTGRAVGGVQAAQILAAAVGPFVGGLLADRIGMRATFFVTAVLCALTFALVARYYQETPLVPADVAAAARRPFREVLKAPGVLPVLAVLFLVNFIGRSFTPILPLHLERLHVEHGRLAFATGVLISAYSIAAAFSASAFGRLSGRLAPVRLLAVSLAGGSATVFPMTMVPSFEAFLVLAVLLGLASGGALTLAYTIGGLAVPAERRTTAFGVFAGGAIIGGAVSPTIAGLFARLDLTAIYWVDGLLYALLAAGLLLRPPRFSRTGAA